MTTPGTYTGADGREYRWQLTAKGNYTNLDEHGYGGVIAPADWPAAKAALDALIEQEAGEWVEWELDRDSERPFSYRCYADGSRPQIKEAHSSEYTDLAASRAAYEFYRKGRSVAQQESAEMRDAARELVEAVLADKEEKFGEWYRRIMDGAKKLEGKL